MDNNAAQHLRDKPKPIGLAREESTVGKRNQRGHTKGTKEWRGSHRQFCGEEQERLGLRTGDHGTDEPGRAEEVGSAKDFGEVARDLPTKLPHRFGGQGRVSRYPSAATTMIDRFRAPS